MKAQLRLACCSLAPLLCSPIVLGQTPITAGNLVVVRIGSGVATLTNAAQPVYLDEYAPTGALVQSIAMPVAANEIGRAHV